MSDGNPPRALAELERRLVERMRLELDRIAQAPRLPPPHDLDAEVRIVSAAVAGHLVGVDPLDLYHPCLASMLAYAVVAAELVPPVRLDTRRLLELHAVDHHPSAAFARSVEWVAETPIVLGSPLVALADRVRTLARRRRALDLLLRVEEWIRTDTALEYGPAKEAFDALKGAEAELRAARPPASTQIRGAA